MNGKSARESGTDANECLIGEAVRQATRHNSLFISSSGAVEATVDVDVDIDVVVVVDRIQYSVFPHNHHVILQEGFQSSCLGPRSPSLMALQRARHRTGKGRRDSRRCAALLCEFLWRCDDDVLIYCCAGSNVWR